MNSKHIVIFDAELKKASWHISIELFARLFLLHQIHKGLDIGSQTAPESIVELRVAFVFLETEDVVYEL